jgi:hypothetical protein
MIPATRQSLINRITQTFATHGEASSTWNRARNGVNGYLANSIADAANGKPNEMLPTPAAQQRPATGKGYRQWRPPDR